MLEKGKLFIWVISHCLFCAQNATSTKADAERTFAEVTELDNEVNNMLKQLQEAEKELKKKQDDADQDMMMAGMVSNFSFCAQGQSEGRLIKASLSHSLLFFFFSVAFARQELG